MWLIDFTQNFVVAGIAYAMYNYEIIVSTVSDLGIFDVTREWPLCLIEDYPPCFLWAIFQSILLQFPFQNKVTRTIQWLPQSVVQPFIFSSLYFFIDILLFGVLS